MTTQSDLENQNSHWHFFFLSPDQIVETKSLRLTFFLTMRSDLENQNSRWHFFFLSLDQIVKTKTEITFFSGAATTKPKSPGHFFWLLDQIFRTKTHFFNLCSDQSREIDKTSGRQIWYHQPKHTWVTQKWSDDILREILIHPTIDHVDNRNVNVCFFHFFQKNTQSMVNFFSLRLKQKQVCLPKQKNGHSPISSSP